jgi:hypothetical protein
MILIIEKELVKMGLFGIVDEEAEKKNNEKAPSNSSDNKFFTALSSEPEEPQTAPAMNMLQNEEVSQPSVRAVSSVEMMEPVPVIKPSGMNESLEVDTLEEASTLNQATEKANIVAPVQEQIAPQAPMDENVAPEPKQPDIVMNDVVASGPKLDANNNGTNPVPVNPVAPVELETEAKVVKVKFLDILVLMVGVFVKPGNILMDNSKKYRNTKSAFVVTAYVTLMSLVLALGVRLAVGGFQRSYNAVSGSYSTVFSLNNIFTQDFFTYILLAAVISGISIVVVSLVYYAASYFTGKGVHLGTYLIITNQAFAPLIIGVNALYPLGALVSPYIGIILLGISFIYSFVIFITGISECIKFASVNKEIIYNVINLSIIFVSIVLIVYLIFYQQLSTYITLIK